MNFPLTKSPWKARAFSVALGAVVAGSWFSSTAMAQVTPRIQVPLGGLTVAPRLQIAVAPQLRAYLVQTKAKVAPQVLDSQVVLRANIPYFKLANGGERQLLPLSLMEDISKTTTADSIPAEFAEVAPYIQSAKITGGSQLSVFKFKPGLVFGLNVDHRPSMTSVKDQASRGTCVAFAANGALEPFSSIADDLSEQYTNDLFMRKEGRPACEAGIVTIHSAGYLADGTVTESLWAYTNSAPPCDITPPASTASATKYKITDSQQIDDNGPTGASIKNPAYLESILRSGKNIVLGTHVAWDGSKAGGILDVVINSSTGQPAASVGGHAMVIVGYNASQDYFIVKNSWGAGYGHAGYLYLSYDYIRTYAKYGYYIKAVSPKLLIMGSGATLQVIPNIRRINPNLVNP